jgi:hypothetical protein
MSKIIIFNNLKGGVGILIPTDEFKNDLDFVASKSLGNGVEYKIVDKEYVESLDFQFRDAWEYSDGIYFNQNKAKSIWKDKWREARKPLLTSLDIEFMKAVEVGNSAKQAEIFAKKQALRDVTKIDIIGNTQEEIKSVWPDILK